VADYASRGMSVKELLNSRWLSGPAFLWKSEEFWPKEPENCITKNEIPHELQGMELKHSAAASCSDMSLNALITYFSSWFRLKRAAAWLMRYIAFIKELRTVSRSRITVDELDEAELKLIKFVQRSHFPFAFNSDSSHLNDQSLKKSLKKADPVLVDGVLRIGGRIDRAKTEFSVKHPIILPSKDHLTNLIIKDAHVKCGHSCLYITWTMLRRCYWIVKGSASTRKAINQCLVCRRRSAPPLHQKMAVLPESRLRSYEPVFSATEVDYFGPFLVTRGRSLEKRYGCLFSCLTTRAVHLEVAIDLSADSFIQVFRRFLARRGQPREIISDNGTNFVGTEKILRCELNQLNSSQLDSFFSQEGITWRFNPPTASLLGGVWKGWLELFGES